MFRFSLGVKNLYIYIYIYHFDYIKYWVSFLLQRSSLCIRHAIFALLRVRWLKKQIAVEGNSYYEGRLKLYKFFFVGYKEDKWFWEW